MSEKRNLALPASGFLLLTFTVGGILWFDVPLKSLRPAQSGAFVQDTFENESVRARLWQDPFGPVYGDPVDQDREKYHEISTIAKRIAGLTTKRPSPMDSAVDKPVAEPNVALMAVMVPGSSFSEDAEIRRRTRHALVSALAARGFVASSGERIGYLDTKWKLPGRLLESDSESDDAPADNDNDDVPISVRIPFEWFERDLLRPANRGTANEWVLVTWLNEEAFRKRTMLKLNELVRKLVTRPNSVSLRLIGPTSSSTLLGLMDPCDLELIENPLTEIPDAKPPEAIAEINNGSSPAPVLLATSTETEAAAIAKTTPNNQGETAKPIASRQSRFVLKGLEIYSSRATAPEGLLVRQRNIAALSQGRVDGEKIPEQSIAQVLWDTYQVKFVCTVVHDDDSAIALVDELQRRGVDLTSDKHHVALIGEWDTFFGRALPFAIEAAIQFRSGEATTGWQLPGTLQLMLDGHVGTPPRVHRFSYMRGLDGSTSRNAARDSPQAAGSKKSSGSPWDVDVSQWERPVGTGGLDYMRRVADKLSRLDRSLMNKGERLKAIGVVGSDVYDKLLVLQALRVRFPNVIFFTTDLDARLLHPSQYPWCRNLVVASSYGLELTPALQGQIPPFRDSYQTSAYFAGLLALGGDDALDLLRSSIEPATNALRSPNDRAWAAVHGEIDPTIESRHLLKPRLFEVARSGAYDITPKSYHSALHPAPFDDRPSGRTFAKVFFLIVIVGLLFMPLNRNFRRFWIDRKLINPPDRQALNYFTFLAVFSCTMFGVLIYLDGKNGEGEPFAWFQGISVWPTEICRLLLLLISSVLFILAIISIKVSNQKLEHDDMLLPDDDRCVEPVFWDRWNDVRQRRMRIWLRLTKTPGQLWRPWRRCVVEWRLFWRARMQISINAWFQQRQLYVPAEGKEAVEIGPLWNRYRELGRIGNRLWRFGPLVVLYMAYGWCLTLLFGEVPVPYRGTIAGATDSAMDFLSTLALVGLTFFVVDATRLCERFIRMMTHRSTTWPATDFIKQMADEKGVAPDEMSDYITVQVVARRTETIGKLITYPFILLFIVLFAGNSYFDNWRWPLQSILFFGLILVYAVICAIVLRNAAEGARSKALGRLRQELLQTYSSKDKNKDARVAQLEMTIDEIRSMRRGAFAPWSRHPIVRAVLIPFGGVGTVALMEMFSMMGR